MLYQSCSMTMGTRAIENIIISKTTRIKDKKLAFLQFKYLKILNKTCHMTSTTSTKKNAKKVTKN